jgi:hypothetical protein
MVNHKFPAYRQAGKPRIPNKLQLPNYNLFEHCEIGIYLDFWIGCLPCAILGTGLGI